MTEIAPARLAEIEENLRCAHEDGNCSYQGIDDVRDLCAALRQAWGSADRAEREVQEARKLIAAFLHPIQEGEDPDAGAIVDRAKHFLSR